MLYIGRGAITFQNCKEEEYAYRIHHAVQTFCTVNKIRVTHLLSIIFTQTQDITHNPAQLLRMFPAYNTLALFCCQESVYMDYLPLTIRMLIFYDKRGIFRISPKPVYLFGAEVLRPDLVHNQDV